MHRQGADRRCADPDGRHEPRLHPLSEEKREKIPALKEILAEDPRPAYQENPERVYGMSFAGMEVRFRVVDGVAEVCEIEEDRNEMQ